MKGEFKHAFTKDVFCLFFILVGSFIAIRFSLWGMEELQANHVSDAVFCFVFAVGGLLFGFLSIFVFNFNRNAFFTMANGKIDARFGWGEELHTDVSHITNAEIQGIHLKVFVDNRIVWIGNLNNAKELCEYILSHITKHHISINIEEEKKEYQKRKRSYIFYLAATMIACAFMFVHIAWCVFLTEGKDMSDFSKSDDVVFVAFVFAEIVTVLIAFLLASKCGKKLSDFNVSKLHSISASAIEHKYDDLDGYPNIIDKKYFDYYTYRIVVFSPKENIFVYRLERFDTKTRSWVYGYESAKGFTTLSELYDDLESSFANVMLED